MNLKDIVDLKSARQCLLFRNSARCDNKECQNKCCPLNKFWDEKDLK